jgi:hypothetical protein
MKGVELYGRVRYAVQIEGLPRNHPHARLSRVGCSPDEHDVALLAKSPIRRRKTPRRSVQLSCRAAATTPRGKATDTEISRVRIISDRDGGMRCAIIETIDCPENKEFPRSPCNAARAQVPKRIAKG